jgi:sugar phosphate permease
MPASRTRYLVLLFLAGLAFVLYLDRICMAQAVEPIRKELKLANTQMGFVLAAFTVAYGLSQVAVGRLGDRFGSRGVLTNIVIWWSVFTALTGAARGFVFLLLVRFLFGVGEAGALPNAARVVSRWLPAHRQAGAMGIVNTSALIGGAVSPVVMAYLIQAVGWRWSFVICAGFGVVWAAFFYAWFRDSPAGHPAVNEAELRLIAGDKGDPRPQKVDTPVPWKTVLASPTIWLLGGVISCASFNSYLYFSWYPTYLRDGREAGLAESGWMAGVVLAGGAVGATLGGVLTDRLLERRRTRKWPLRLIASLSLTAGGICLLASILCANTWATVVLATISCFATMIQLGAWWRAVIEISGEHLGALSGLMNSLGVPGAAASQLFVGFATDWLGQQGYTGRAQWDPAFYVFTALLFLGAAGWLFIDPERSAVEPSFTTARTGSAHLR